MTNDTQCLDLAQSILERECRDGRDSLSPQEIDIFHVYRFLCEFENGGLSGLLYNLSPEFAELQSLSSVVRRLCRDDLATLLDSVFDVASRGPADFHGTWSDWLSVADPEQRIPDLDERISGCYEALWDDLPRLTQ